MEGSYNGCKACMGQLQRVQGEYEAATMGIKGYEAATRGVMWVQCNYKRCDVCIRQLQGGMMGMKWLQGV